MSDDVVGKHAVDRMVHAYFWALVDETALDSTVDQGCAARRRQRDIREAVEIVRVVPEPQHRGTRTTIPD